VRNAAVHASGEAREKLWNLVRPELGHLPLGTTIGRFLLMNRPNSVPAESYIDHYTSTLKDAAQRIVR
jgi:hypothetical protein